LLPASKIIVARDWASGTLLEEEKAESFFRHGITNEPNFSHAAMKSRTVAKELLRSSRAMQACRGIGDKTRTAELYKSQILPIVEL